MKILEVLVCRMDPKNRLHPVGFHKIHLIHEKPNQWRENEELSAQLSWKFGMDCFIVFPYRALWTSGFVNLPFHDPILITDLGLADKIDF